MAGVLEPAVGWRRFIVVYAFSAVGGSLLSAWIDQPAVSAGASGAIFGLAAAAMAAALWRADLLTDLEGGVRRSGW